MTIESPQTQGIRLHHEQRRRQLSLLSAICRGAVKVGEINLYEGVCIIHINENRFETTLDDNGLPCVGSGLSSILGRIHEPIGRNRACS